METILSIHANLLGKVNIYIYMKKKKELGRVKILIEVKVLGEEDVLGK